jgi:hypothetical protein
LNYSSLYPSRAVLRAGGKKRVEQVAYGIVAVGV